MTPERTPTPGTDATSHATSFTEDPRDLDILVWGATGYTGRLVAEELVELAALEAAEGRTLAWGLGGRSLDKLREVRAQLASRYPARSELVHLPLLVGDSLHRASLAPLVRRARVVATTVGPYSRYGDALVDLCAETGTHYCDLSGEVPWMQRTIDRLHGTAGESGARIVHCCGFDSIPSDLGAWVAHRELETVGSGLRRGRLRVGSTKGGFSGGTVASMVDLFKAAREDQDVRRALLDPYALNPAGQRGRDHGPDETERFTAVHDEDRRTWTGPFVMAGINTRVVRRTNALLDDPYGRDFSYDEAIDTGRGLAGRAKAYALAAGLAAFTGAVAFPPTGELLERHVLPSPGEGPSVRDRMRGFFRIAFHGEGERLGPEAEPTAGLEGLVPRVLVTITGDRDPGYGATARMLAASALCLARDEQGEGTWQGGGVLTPASSFGSALVERLAPRGVRFEAELL